MTKPAESLTAVSAHPRGSALSVTVVPRAAKTTIEAMTDGTLRIRVAAPPVDGAANAALLRFLAAILDVPRTRLEIVSGGSSRHKRIVVDGLAPNAAGKRLQDALGTGR